MADRKCRGEGFGFAVRSKTRYNTAAVNMRKQALNDIAVIPEYYPCGIPGGGQDWRPLLELVRVKPSKRVSQTPV